MGSTTNLIQGTGTLYIGAFGATEPADGEIHNPPASGTWTDVGFTKDGVSLSVSHDQSELDVDQIIDIVGTRITKREIKVSTSLAEPTLDNLLYVLNGGTVTDNNTSAASGTSGTDLYEPDTDLTGDPTYRALIFDGYAPNGMVRRVVVRKVLSVAAFEAQYTKDNQTVFSVEFKAHYVSDSIKPFKIVDQTAVPTG